jgi:hypothetical protein
MVGMSAGPERGKIPAMSSSREKVTADGDVGSIVEQNVVPNEARDP